MAALERAVATKADADRTEALLAERATVREVNEALIKVHDDVGAPGGVRDMAAALRDQALLLDSLAAEHLVGRWLWKSGRPRQNHLIPWDVQVINTNPDNFGWEERRSFIAVTSGGLYEFTLGVYTRKKPTVAILVNGEAVLSAIHSSSYAVHHSSGRLVSVSGHPDGAISGVTLIDFLALPANCRIAVSYRGEPGAEGFVGLRKL